MWSLLKPITLHLLAFLSLPALLACTPGSQLGPLPELADPTTFSNVYIVRARNTHCPGIPILISVDGTPPFVSISSAENASFRLTPGEHTITVKFPKMPGKSESFLFSAQESYYFLIQTRASADLPLGAIHPIGGLFTGPICSAELLQIDEFRGPHRVRTSRPVLPVLE